MGLYILLYLLGVNYFLTANEVQHLDCMLMLTLNLQSEEIFAVFHTVSHSQITRLYSRFTSLDKGENGTLR